MTQPKLLELAKQGDPQSIAILMNRSLESQGISAKVTRLGDRLFVLLEADRVPDRLVLTNFVRNGITNLKLQELIRTVEIAGQKTGSAEPIWTQELELDALEIAPGDFSATVMPEPPLDDTLENLIVDRGSEPPNDLNDFDALSLDSIDPNEMDFATPDEFSLDLNESLTLEELENPDLPLFDENTMDSGAIDLDLSGSFDPLDDSSLSDPISLDSDFQESSLDFGEPAAIDLDLSGSFDPLDDSSLSDPISLDSDFQESSLDFGEPAAIDLDLSGSFDPLDDSSLNDPISLDSDFQEPSLDFEDSTSLNSYDLSLSDDLSFAIEEDTEPGFTDINIPDNSDFSLDLTDDLSDPGFSEADNLSLEEMSLSTFDESAPDFEDSDLSFEHSSSPQSDADFSAPDLMLSDSDSIDDFLLQDPEADLQLNELNDDFATPSLEGSDNFSLNLDEDYQFDRSNDLPDRVDNDPIELPTIDTPRLGTEFSDLERPTWELEDSAPDRYWESPIDFQEDLTASPEESLFGSNDFSLNPDLSPDSASDLDLTDESYLESVNLTESSLEPLSEPLDESLFIETSGEPSFLDQEEPTFEDREPAAWNFDDPESTAEEETTPFISSGDEFANPDFAATPLEMGGDDVLLDRPLDDSELEFSDRDYEQPADLTESDLNLNQFADLPLSEDDDNLATFDEVDREESNALLPDLIPQVEDPGYEDLSVGSEDGFSLEGDAPRDLTSDESVFNQDLVLDSDYTPAASEDFYWNLEQPATDRADEFDTSEPSTEDWQATSAETWDVYPPVEESDAVRDPAIDPLGNPLDDAPLWLPDTSEDELVSVSNQPAHESGNGAIDPPPPPPVVVAGASENRRSPNSLLLPIALLVGAWILGLIGFAFWKRQPQPNITTPTASPTVPVASDSAADPFQAALATGANASSLTQSAQSPDDWTQVATEWQSAIDLLGQVPQDNPNHAAAQQKLQEYQRNLAYAQKQIGDRSAAVVPTAAVAQNAGATSCPTIADAADSPPVELTGAQFGQSNGLSTIVGCLTNHTEQPIANVSIVYREDSASGKIGKLLFSNLQPGNTVPFRADFAVDKGIDRAQIQSIFWAAPGTAAERVDVSIEIAR